MTKLTLEFDHQPRQIDLNELYREVAEREAGADEQSIAQISETCARLLDVLAERHQADKRFTLDLACLLEHRAKGAKGGA